MGDKSEAKIIAGIEAYKRRGDRVPLGKAWPFAQQMLAYLAQAPGVEKTSIGGSLRRMRSTVGDLDLLAAAADSSGVMQAFVSHPQVMAVISRGETKASVEFDNNLRAQLWVHPPERFGTALQYATGSKDHNVRLRELALKKGLSLSDQAFLKEDGTELLVADEEEVYATLGLPWIPPELREDHGEVEAALAGRLPRLIEVGDIHADLHAHSTWSDGELSIREMAEAAVKRGHRVPGHHRPFGQPGGGWRAFGGRPGPPAQGDRSRAAGDAGPDYLAAGHRGRDPRRRQPGLFG